MLAPARSMTSLRHSSTMAAWQAGMASKTAIHVILARHLRTSGHGRSGRQRSIGHPHEIPRGAHAAERRL
jgi:hypothetical protein